MRRAIGCALGWLLCACSGVEAEEGSSEVGAAEPGNPELAAPQPDSPIEAPAPFATPSSETDTAPPPVVPVVDEPEDSAVPPLDPALDAEDEVALLPSDVVGEVTGTGAATGFPGEEQGTQTGDQGSGGGAIGAGGGGGAASGGGGPCEPTGATLPETTRWFGTVTRASGFEGVIAPSGDDGEVTVELAHARDATSDCGADVDATLTYSSESLSFSATFVLTFDAVSASGEVSVPSEQLPDGTELPAPELFTPVEAEPTTPGGAGGGGSAGRASGPAAQGGAPLGGGSGVAGVGTPDGEAEVAMCLLDPSIPDASAPLGVSLNGFVVIDTVSDSMNLRLSWARREDGEARWYTLPYGCAELGLATE